MKAFSVFLFGISVFWILLTHEMKIHNLELKQKQLLEYVEKLERKVDTDYSIIINKGWE